MKTKETEMNKFQVWHLDSRLLNESGRSKMSDFSFGMLGAEFPSEYKKVAMVETENLDKAFELTNHIDRSWNDPPLVGVVPTPGNHRSTSVGDAIIDDKTGWVHLVASIGFVKIGRMDAMGQVLLDLELFLLTTVENDGKQKTQRFFDKESRDGFAKYARERMEKEELKMVSTTDTRLVDMVEVK